MARTSTKERAFEDEVEAALAEKSGYRALDAQQAYDRSHRLVPDELFAFIEETQPEAWERLTRIHGASAKAFFLRRLCQELDQRGTLDVLRHGVVDQGVEFALAYHPPAHELNPELVRRYAANRVAVLRQVPYSPDHEKALDLVLTVNGLPVATAELKNPMTGQRAKDATRQYRKDREPTDTLLSKRAFVHFAVDPDEAYMTTRLAGEQTRFLPFNRGTEEAGAGNPSNPDGHRTAYLWERVWERDAWLDLILRFAHVEYEKPKRRRGKRKGGGQVIFPRFHQWDAVLGMEAHARGHGPGQNYLVEHSAGSGKSKTIAWLAHRLASLHDDGGRKVFDKIVVVTDRRVLDQQLQDTIAEFETQPGVVARVGDEAKKQGRAKSERLAEVLASGQEKVVICTLQTFPLVVETAGEQEDRSHAVIVDEAHSSQSGEAARDLRAALGSDERSEEEILEAAAEADAAAEPRDGQDEVNEIVEQAARSRGRRSNLSFFAFTATPKGKTLELFGTPANVGDGGECRYVPFHTYSMRQAIEEGFILDVLENYVTYETYYKLSQAAEEDPEVPTSKASSAAARYVKLHPHNLAQKAQIIVEHFRERTAPQIGGRAKAMVVTSSRLHAVRFKQAIDRYIEEQGYTDIGALVAFSGTVHDPEGGEFTEAGMNHLPETQTVTAFAGEDYHLMVVAEKYQTGFDQPLLHTMFVDKKLEGVNAVQTLSRLNRTLTYPKKEDTFVLDFVNDAEAIQAAFRPFYERTVAVPTDRNAAHDASRELDRFRVIDESDADRFAKLYFEIDPQDRKGHAQLHACLDPAVERVEKLNEDEGREFRRALKHFVSVYAFLSQIVPFADGKLEKRYIYCRYLRQRLPEDRSGAVDLGDDIELTHYKIEKTGEHNLSLVAGEGELSAFTGDGSGSVSEERYVKLSEILEKLNERFGLGLGPEDQLQIEGIGEHMAQNDRLREKARANDLANFRYPFEEEFTDAVVTMMERNESLSTRILNDPSFREAVQDVLLPYVYEQSRKAEGEPHR